jgi:hypothetical protein
LVRLGRPPPDAGDRRGEGHRLGRGEIGDQAGLGSAGSNPASRT